MSINNNLIGGIVDIHNPIEALDMRNKMNLFQFDRTTGKTNVLNKDLKKDSQKDKKIKARTIEEIEQMLLTRKIVNDDKFDEDNDSNFVKVVTMAPGFVYGVDTREYYPTKNVPVGPSISDMS